MATEKKLDCVIMGLLSHEEMTGYEIKKRIDTVLKYFWGASYGSIYPTLSDLVDRGLATKREGTENKRNKLIYTITDSGRSYLKEWLALPVTKDELHYETLLKLFFGGEVGSEEILKHIDRFEAKIRQELPILQLCVEQLSHILENDDHKYYYLTAKFGVETYQGYLKWCQEAREMLNGSEPYRSESPAVSAKDTP